MAPKLTIRVAQDHDVLRAVTDEVLRLQGHQVHGIVSAALLDEGGAALDADIFVIDLKLPSEDRLSLLDRIRTLRPSAGIIIMSSLRSVAARRVVFKRGADVYLSKPVAPEELIAAVTALQRALKG